jgi:predicted transcriptional regulator
METLRTSEQLRQARSSLSWDSATLAKRARVPITVVKRLESLNGPLDEGAKVEAIRALQVTLEKAGASFA